MDQKEKGRHERRVYTKSGEDSLIREGQSVMPMEHSGIC